ncbi:MAG: 16S rRNA (guanine(527)-N(7))-methyltransferase RsmG [Hyphomicrobiaceae bacterium]|nr:16S rRNA (guanine(527)-N(7))-methyltransferase RsmG [Hyphomicrobiaceae bacterium]
MREVVHIDGPETFAAAFDVSRETLERLELYAALLRQWQKAVNLVAPSTLDEVWHRHLADSAQIVPLAEKTPGLWLDMGSGAGFPGLVAAILRQDPRYAPVPREGSPPSKVVLVESHARKCAFLREVARQAGLAPMVDILSTRIESLPTQARLPVPAVVSARALAALDRLLAYSAPLFGTATVGLFLKGQGVDAEIAEARKAWSFEARLVASLTEPQGRIVVIRKLAALSARGSMAEGGQSKGTIP